MKKLVSHAAVINLARSRGTLLLYLTLELCVSAHQQLFLVKSSPNAASGQSNFLCR